MGDGNKDRTERIARDMERLLRAMNEEGVAGGMVGPDGLTLGIPNWEERTKHLRPSERVKTHGYPLGFAKGQQALREGVMERYFGHVSASGGDEAAPHQLAHEAVAKAVDWERFLGSFNHAGEDRFPLDAVDLVADHLLSWLDHQGFRVVPKETLSEAMGKEGRTVAPRVVDEELPVVEDGGTDMGIPDNTIRCRACDGAGCAECGERGWLH